MYRNIIIILVLLSLGVNSRGQTDVESEKQIADTTQVNSVVFRKTDISPEDVSVVLRKAKPHSPTKATLLSMALPGLGQIYNGQWWKVPILYGGIGATIYGMNWNISMYKKYKSAFADYVEYTSQVVPEGGKKVKVNDETWRKVYIYDVSNFDSTKEEWFKSALKNRKDSYRRDRDLTVILMAGIYVLNIIDATVFAHFYDFDISDDLSMGVRPKLDYTPTAGGSVGVSCTINF